MVEVRRKLENLDYNFCQVQFPANIDFSSAALEDADFRGAVFWGDALFHDAQFIGAADFAGARFEGHAFFVKTRFELLDFSGTKFAGADFIACRFQGFTAFISTRIEGKLDFTGAIFEQQCLFYDSYLGNCVLFKKTAIAENAIVALRFSTVVGPLIFECCCLQGNPPITFDQLKIESPQDVSFVRCDLEAWWLLGTPAGDFIYREVTWGTLSYRALAAQLEESSRHRADSPAALTSLYRALAQNAAKSQAFESATALRFAGHTLKRLERKNLRLSALSDLKQTKQKGIKKALGVYARIILQTTDPLHAMYRLSNGYGERPLRALVVAMALLAAFSLGYMLYANSPLNSLLCTAFTKNAPFVPNCNAPSPFQALALLVPIQFSMLIFAVKRRMTFR